jgi:hypothetical protein
MQIHYLVLKRVDGSVLRQRYVAASGVDPRFNTMIEVSLTGPIPILARVLRVAMLGRATAHGPELIIYAQEVMCVPVAANDT